jgi:hypothetical protein
VKTLGLIFDEAPSLYDRYRPGYPPAAVDALVELARLGPGARVLEVGVLQPPGPPETTSGKLLQAIRSFVDAHLGGVFVDRYVTTLTVGRRTDRA